MVTPIKTSILDLPGEAEHILGDDGKGDVAPQEGVLPPQLSKLFVHLEVAGGGGRLPLDVHLRVVWIDGKPGGAAIGEPCQGGVECEVMELIVVGVQTSA